MRLNRLQSSWAKTILGAPGFTEIRGTLAVAECGWNLRLGTAMLEKTVLFYNKLLLLPAIHPAKMMLKLALLVPCHSWARRVRDIMSDPRLAAPIPDIVNANVITNAEERQVLTDNAVRRRVLRNQVERGAACPFAFGLHCCCFPQRCEKGAAWPWYLV